nr:hypothetical protein [uncultured Allomuricauda sp.]
MKRYLPRSEKSTKLKQLICFIVYLFFVFGHGQECLLGIGGQNDENIIKVFQLDDAQKEKMMNWSAELKIRNGILKEQAKFLLKKHEQSPPEDLMVMSYKYRSLLDSMKQNLKILDTKLLSIFNNRQYNLYMELCSGISLRPIHVNRSFGEK